MFWKMILEVICDNVLSLILHKESLTDIHAQLRPDGLNGCVYLLLVTDQSNAKLYKLIEAQSCNL